MGRGSGSHRRLSLLPVQRFCLRLVSAIADAATWAVFAQDNGNLAAHLRAQVLSYFISLDDLGAFADDRFVVECATSVTANAGRAVTMLIVFHPAPSNEPVSLKLHLTASGCRVGSAAFVPSADHRDESR